jgi:prepilin-type N-terminal cleavage/methylation domain-containing protein
LLYGPATMRTQRAERGFTLIEILAVLLIMMVLALYSTPKLMTVLHRAKIEGVAKQTANLMRAARMEAIKRNCYGVVAIEPDNRRVVAYADIDRDGVFDETGATPDRLISRIDLPSMIDFENQSGGKGLASVRGFENPTVPVVLPDGQAMFQPDGSVLKRDTWTYPDAALRFADRKGNYLEVNVTLRTGRVEVRKYENGTWYANGDGGKSWDFEQN